jgi:DNA polymerase III subunit gamma/tau
VQCLVDRKAGEALAEVDAALLEGVDVGQLLEQLLGYLRDCMAAAVGCSPDQFLFASIEGRDEVNRAAKQLGLDTILAMIQIVEQALSRLRFSTLGRTLLEIAIVRMCALENLDSIADLVANFSGGPAAVPSAPVQKKTEQPAVVASARTQSTDRETASEAQALPSHDSANTGSTHGEAGEIASLPNPQGLPPLNDEAATAIWKQALESLSGLLFDFASTYERAAISAPNKLVISFPGRYNQAKLFCERPEQFPELERAVAEAAGRPLRLEFVSLPEEKVSPPKRANSRPTLEQRQRTAAKAEHPMVRRAVELFGAEVVRIDEPTP